MNAPAPAESPLDLARARMQALQARLSARGLVFRRFPPEPQTCCGRGCNGCVWEGFHDAVTWWCEDAEALLAGDAAG